MYDFVICAPHYKYYPKYKIHKSETELDEDSEDSVNDAQHEDNSGVDDGFFVGERSDTGNDSDRKHSVSHDNTPHQPNGGNDHRPFPVLPPSYGGPNIVRIRMNTNGI